MNSSHGFTTNSPRFRICSPFRSPLLSPSLFLVGREFRLLVKLGLLETNKGNGQRSFSPRPPPPPFSSVEHTYTNARMDKHGRRLHLHFRKEHPPFREPAQVTRRSYSMRCIFPPPPPPFRSLLYRNGDSRTLFPNTKSEETVQPCSSFRVSTTIFSTEGKRTEYRNIVPATSEREENLDGAYVSYGGNRKPGFGARTGEERESARTNAPTFPATLYPLLSLSPLLPSFSCFSRCRASAPKTRLYRAGCDWSVDPVIHRKRRMQTVT